MGIPGGTPLNNSAVSECNSHFANVVYLKPKNKVLKFFPSRGHNYSRKRKIGIGPKRYKVSIYSQFLRVSIRVNRTQLERLLVIRYLHAAILSNSERCA